MMPNGLDIDAQGKFRPAETQAYLRKFGVVRNCAAFVLAGVVTTSTVASVSAGAISDLFVCAKENVSISELTDHFEQSNWNAEKPKAADILGQVIFLGNVDAANPTTWKATADWAASLSTETAPPNSVVFATATTAIAIEATSHGHIACLIVSDEVLETGFKAELPDLNLRDYSGRRFGKLLNSNLQVSATFLSADAAALAQLTDGRKTAATILNKTASLKEE